MTDDNQDKDDEEAGSIQDRIYSGKAHPTTEVNQDARVPEDEKDLIDYVSNANSGNGGGHSLYNPSGSKKDFSDVDWDKWRNDVDTEDDEGSVTTHTCDHCGWVTELDTPHIRTRSYCQGECDSFSRFVRSDQQ